MATDLVIEQECAPCPLGCPDGDTPVIRSRDWLHDVPGDYTVVKCGTCGLMRTNPRPSPGSMGIYYPEDYGPFASSIIKTPRRAQPRPAWKRAIRRLLEFNTNRLPPLEPGRMLEIGCASGSFLHEMAGEGWIAEGIEFSPKAAQAAASAGYQVYNGTVECAPEPQAPYDLIVGWMVLEHLHDPLLALQKMRSWTKPGAWLALSVPNCAAYEFGLFRQSWYPLQLPTHLFHYTPDTMRKLLDRGGWTMTDVHYHRVVSDPVASLGLRMKQIGFSRRIADKLIHFPEHAGYTHYAFLPMTTVLGWFGQLGRMTVWAQRSDA